MVGAFRVADWIVEPQRNSLERNGQTLRLEPKIMQVLVCLADRGGDVVPKEQLIRAVWPDVFVTGDVLTRSVSELRKALGDDPKRPRFIETIPKGGYRLVATVESLPSPLAPEITQATSARRRIRLTVGGAVVLVILLLAFASRNVRNGVVELFGRHQVATVSAVRSIAVLPLENLSGDAAQEYFADGMTDELITNLAKVESLRVISRTSVMQYKRAHEPLPDIARALHVELILTGSVLRSGDQVRITTQLVDGKTDSHLWAQEFERDLRNVLRMEADIAHTIAEEISGKLSRSDGARLQSSHFANPQAHDLYLRGRYQWHKKTGESVQASIRSYQEALVLDATYALVYAGMADSYIILEDDGHLSPVEAYPLIRNAAKKAVELDPDLADAHMVLAASKETEWDWKGAEAEYRRAIELNPSLARAHHWYASLLANLNRPSEAISEIQRALELDPLQDSLHYVQVGIYYLARQYDQAERLLNLIETPGKRSSSSHYFVAGIRLQQKLYPSAISESVAATHAFPDDPASWAVLALAYGQAGEKTQAREALGKLKQISAQRTVPPFWFAVAYEGLGDNDRAISFLNDAYQIKSSQLATALVSPLLDPLRSDPRFQTLLHQIGLQ